MTRSQGIVGALILGVSGVAVAFPWTIDMADTQAVKAYSDRMAPLPEGVIAQGNMLSPKGHAPNAARGSEAATKLVAPIANDERLALGAEMYNVYCTPCHGADGIELGPVAATELAPDRMPGIAVLAGPAGVARTIDDEWIYLTIRNGGAVMPAYGHTMSDEEMWSIVYHVRTLENAMRDTPEGASPEAPEEASP